MKTINELGIYFMCCFIFATLFITYLAVKLRAYRIKNASLTNRIEIADKDIADAYDEVDKVKLSLSHHRTESAAIINQSAENNAKLVLEIESLKSDRQKLFDIAKGATAKLAEMNVALEGLEVKEEKYWSKEAFPEMYVIHKGTICVSTIKNNWDAFINEKGTKFKSLQNSIAPYLERIEGKHRKNSYNKSVDGYIDACIGSHNLAPLNPLDHPNHPNFRG